jgi:septum formation inhibitor MinC
MDEINQLQSTAKREKAEAELLSLHPDFEEIRATDDFHNWAEAQPKWVQDALYENETDARSAARAIDLYKVDQGNQSSSKTNTKKANTKDAARAVNTKAAKAAPETSTDSGKWKESTVEGMSSQQYEKHAESIMEAIRSGEFIYDISGSAR